jgi:hypothetical protein
MVVVVVGVAAIIMGKITIIGGVVVARVVCVA